MESIGPWKLRQEASEYVRRAEPGEAFEVVLRTRQPGDCVGPEAFVELRTA